MLNVICSCLDPTIPSLIGFTQRGPQMSVSQGPGTGLGGFFLGSEKIHGGTPLSPDGL